MTRDDVNLIAFDRAFELKARLLFDDAVTQNRGHFPNRIFIHLQLGGDLPVGKVQPHEVQAKHPNAQRLMMSREYGSREIVE